MCQCDCLQISWQSIPWVGQEAWQPGIKADRSMSQILERPESLKIGNWRDQRCSNHLLESPWGLSLDWVTCLHVYGYTGDKRVPRICWVDWVSKVIYWRDWITSKCGLTNVCVRVHKRVCVHKCMCEGFWAVRNWKGIAGFGSSSKLRKQGSRDSSWP